MGTMYVTDYAYVAVCDGCGQDLVGNGYAERHTPGTLDFHPECCPECN